jgi:hypothetical protein
VMAVVDPFNPWYFMPQNPFRDLAPHSSPAH